MRKLSANEQQLFDLIEGEGYSVLNVWFFHHFGLPGSGWRFKRGPDGDPPHYPPAYEDFFLGKNLAEAIANIKAHKFEWIEN